MDRPKAFDANLRSIDIKALEDGRIERIGPDKGGLWAVKAR